MTQQDIDSIVGYGAAALVGMTGLSGWVQARSAPSLIAGVASGLLLAVGTSRTIKDPSNVDITVVMSSVLAGLMLHKVWSHNGKLLFWPSGVIAALCGVNLVRFAPRLSKRL